MRSIACNYVSTLALFLTPLQGSTLKFTFTFFLLSAWIGCIFLSPRWNPRAATDGVIFVVLIFICVLGHALTAAASRGPTLMMKSSFEASVVHRLPSSKSIPSYANSPRRY